MTVSQLKAQIIVIKLYFTFNKEKQKNLVKQLEEIWYESRLKTADEENILIVYKLELYAVLVLILSNILLSFLTMVSIAITYNSAN